MDTDALADEILGTPRVRDRELRRLIMDRMARGGAVKMGKGGLLKKAVKEALRLAAPQDEALRVAQKNAAKPVSKGGLGLRPDNTPMERARAMGIDTPAFHFSRHGADVPELDSGKYAIAPFDAVGTHVGTKEAALDRYAKTVGTKKDEGKFKGVVYPVFIRKGRQLLNESGEPFDEEALLLQMKYKLGHEIDYGNLPESNKALRNKIFSKYDSIPYINDVEDKGQISYIMPPKNIRSRFAAFDPARIDENDLLAGFAALGITAPMLTSEEPEYRAGGAVMMKRGGKAKGDTMASMDTGKVEMRKAPGAEKAKDILSGAAEFLPFVGAGKAAAEGDYPSAALQGALDVAGGPLVKGAAALGGKALPALAGIFIGPNSRIWNKKAAKEFEKLEQSGFSNKEAYLKTGTFRSPDGGLRQEISDAPSRIRTEMLADIDRALDKNKLEMEKGWTNELEEEKFNLLKKWGEATKMAKQASLEPLKKVIHHPEAFKAYPELGWVEGKYLYMPKGPEQGYFSEPKWHQQGAGLFTTSALKQMPGGNKVLSDWLADNFKARTTGQPEQHLDSWIKQNRPEVWSRFEQIDQLPWTPWDAAKLSAEGETAERARSVMLHEMQHGIQRLEGSALGGNPNVGEKMLPKNMHMSDFVDQINKHTKQLSDERDEVIKQFKESGQPFSMDNPLVRRSREIGDQLDKNTEILDKLAQKNYFPLYQRMAGEAESRAVQSRMRLTPEERAEMFPLESYDVPLEHLVVRREKYAKGGEVKLKEGGMDYEQLKKLAPFYADYGPGPDEEEEQARRRLADLERRVVARDYAEPPKATMQEGLRGALQSGLGRVMPERQAGRYADLFSEAGSYVLPPMIGEEAGYALGRAYEAGKRGDYGEAALEGTMGALGVLPAAPGVKAGARMAERGANVAVPNIRRPFTPATITVEATAPDLGQMSTVGFRQGLNDRLLRQLSAGRKAREGQGVFFSDITEMLETNPMLAIDVPRAGKIGEGVGSNEALRREIAQAGIDLNQESMGAHRFMPLVTNNPEDASAMLIKSKGGLSNEEVIELGKRLGNYMVVAHNPRLGGVVIYPFGPVGKGGAPEFDIAKKTAEEILGKKGKIQYGVADYDKDRLYMQRSSGDYQRAGAQPMSAEQADLRKKLQGLEKFMFTNDPEGVPGNIQGAPLGGLQPWSRGPKYPTHVQGIGTKPDYRAVNYATEEFGQRRPTYDEAEKDRAALLDKWHRTLPGKVR